MRSFALGTLPPQLVRLTKRFIDGCYVAAGFDIGDSTPDRLDKTGFVRSILSFGSNPTLKSIFAAEHICTGTLLGYTNNGITSRLFDL